MSFNKQRDFQALADEAEKEFIAQAKGETAVSTPEAPAEPTQEETTQVAPPPEPTVPVEDERYKAAVKAMNEAQRKAAESAKREEEFAKRQADLEAKLDEAVEQARLAMQRVPPPVDEPDDDEDSPELARLAERKARRVVSPLEQRISEMEKRLREEAAIRQQLEKESRAKAMLSEIRSIHPDYDELVNSDGMTTWINTEAPPIYKAIFDGTIPYQTKDAVAVLNAYKQTTTPKAKGNTVSAAEVAAPVKTIPNINPKTANDNPITEKEANFYMHNSHKMSAADHAEWDRRFNG